MTSAYSGIATFAFSMELTAFAVQQLHLCNARSLWYRPHLAARNPRFEPSNRQRTLLCWALLFALLSFIVVNQVATSPLGRVLLAIREDEVFAAAQGEDRFADQDYRLRCKRRSCSIGRKPVCPLSETSIDPNNFNVYDPVVGIFMVILGGAGSRWGSLIGVAILVRLFGGLSVSRLANCVRRTSARFCTGR